MTVTCSASMMVHLKVPTVVGSMAVHLALAKVQLKVGSLVETMAVKMAAIAVGLWVVDLAV